MQTEGLGGQQLKINQAEVLLGIPLVYKVERTRPRRRVAGAGGWGLGEVSRPQCTGWGSQERVVPVLSHLFQQLSSKKGQP